MKRNIEKVFYCDNGGDQSLDYLAAFRRAADALGYEGLAYSGLTAQTRQLSLDREIRDDFYDANRVIILFGKTPIDSWVLPELGVRPLASERKIMIFATDALHPKDLLEIGSAIIVSDPDEFEVKVKNSLAAEL